MMIVLFDHDCGLCTHSVARWKKSSPAGMQFVAFDHFDHSAHGLAEAPERGSVVLLEDDGAMYRAAEAVLRIMSHSGQMRWVYGLYRNVPGVAWCAEFLYARVARNRHHISRIMGYNKACPINQ